MDEPWENRWKNREEEKDADTPLIIMKGNRHFLAQGSLFWVDVVCVYLNRLARFLAIFLVQSNLKFRFLWDNYLSNLLNDSLDSDLCPLCIAIAKSFGDRENSIWIRYEIGEIWWTYWWCDDCQGLELHSLQLCFVCRVVYLSSQRHLSPTRVCIFR